MHSSWWSGYGENNVVEDDFEVHYQKDKIEICIIVNDEVDEVKEPYKEDDRINNSQLSRLAMLLLLK